MQNIEKTIMQRGIAILLPTKMKRRLDGIKRWIDVERSNSSHAVCIDGVISVNGMIQ